MSVFDDLEQLSPESREKRLFDHFAVRLKQCVDSCPGLARHLQGIDIEAVNDREGLQSLPILRKQELMEAQQTKPPFGGFVDMDSLEGMRVFMSPGPVWEPQLAGNDPWQAARALHAAGIGRGDRVHNAFSYHTTPGGFILDEGARALGCIVFPAGTGGTETQVQAIQHLQAQVYVGTPDYLQTLIDHASETDQPRLSINRALVSGGALFPAMRARYGDYGIHVQQCYATADLGVIAYETASDGIVHPGMAINENLVVEIVVPGTGIAVAPGEVGEVVVTRLSSAYPLVRFATGDLSAQMIEPSPDDRTQLRLKGWMGRADQRVKVRGMFVDPVQLQVLKKDNPGIERWRLSVSRESDRDVMNLQVTLAGVAATSLGVEQRSALQDSLVNSLKRATGMQGTVNLVDQLPADGVIVDDQRNYEQD